MKETRTFTAEPNSLEATTTYVMNQPRERVFAAFIDRDLLPKWWLIDATLTVEEMDVRDGGQWRFVQQMPQGDFAFHGVYHRVDAPSQIVMTWGFDATQAVFLETVTFEDVEGDKTRITDQFVFQTVADREMMLSSGMEQGTIPMFERLEKLL